MPKNAVLENIDSRSDIKSLLGLKGLAGLRVLLNYSHSHLGDVMRSKEGEALSNLRLHEQEFLVSPEGLKKLVMYASSMQQEEKLMSLNLRAITGLEGAAGLEVLRRYIATDKNLAVVTSDTMTTVFQDSIAQDPVLTMIVAPEGSDEDAAESAIQSVLSDIETGTFEICLSDDKANEYIDKLLLEIMPEIRVSRFNNNLAGKVESQIDMALSILDFRLKAEDKQDSLVSEKAEALHSVIETLTETLMPDLNDSERLALCYLIVESVASENNNDIECYVDSEVIEPLLEDMLPQLDSPPLNQSGLEAMNKQTQLLANIIDANMYNSDDNIANRKAYLELLRGVNTSVNKIHDYKNRYSMASNGFVLVAFSSLVLLLISPFIPVLEPLAGSAGTLALIAVCTVGTGGHMAANAAILKRCGHWQNQLQQINMSLLGMHLGESNEKVKSVQKNMLSYVSLNGCPQINSAEVLGDMSAATVVESTVKNPLHSGYLDGRKGVKKTSRPGSLSENGLSVKKGPHEAAKTAGKVPSKH